MSEPPAMTLEIGLRLPIRWQFQSLRAFIRAPILVAFAYFLGAEAAFFVGTLSDRIFAPFWPPNVILFCALLLAPERRWWLYLAAAFPAHLAAELQVGMPAGQLVVAFATNCSVAVLNAAVTRRVLGELPWFGSLRKASLYILITAVANPAVAALGGAFVPILGGEPGRYLVFWAQWYLSNALGSLTLGPIFLIWLGGKPRWPLFASSGRAIEAVVLGVSLVVVCTLAFQLGTGTVAIGFMPALLYSPLPLILWSATRFGERGASGAILVVTVVLLWCSLNSSGLFIAGDAETNVLAVQIFLIGLSIPILLLGASIDEARRAELATCESEERMEFAAASADIGLWYFEPAKNELWMTDHCRNMLGLALDSPPTLATIQQVIHPEDRRAAIVSMRSAPYAEEKAATEFRVVLPGDQVRWLRGHAHADRDERGKPFRVSGIFTDITAAKMAERKAAEQRSELAHMMRVSVLGELSGAIAHELNQPLTAILSNAEAARIMLTRKPLPLADLGETIDDIVHEDKRASAVIERLRGLLKKGERRLEPVDLNQLIGSTLELLHSELIGRRFRVTKDLAHDLPPAYGDPVQLQQVLLNLLMNAMDAMTAVPPARRVVTVGTRLRDSDETEIVVADRGRGLGPEQQAKVFEPFFSTKIHGLGLGLSICLSIVNSHGGQLRLVNDPDGGAQAIFTLPHRDIPGAEK
jgi:signal transduction histidine kinase/integral membrane sensor domain MASE1